VLTIGILTDGRTQYLEQCLKSLLPTLEAFPHFVIDDSGDKRRGMAGAVRACWERALESGADHYFHVEEDFTFENQSPLTEMVEVLERNPRLAQVVLKRNPWSDEEIRAGGQIEISPEDYEDRDGFVAHRKLFSFNPSVIPRRVLELCLAEPGDGLESGFTATLLAHGYEFAYFGKREDPPRCTHIGLERSRDYRW
jgi:hypothetical protein